jgi:hypothetical protein
MNFCFDSKTNCVYEWNEINGKKTINYNKIYNSFLSAAKFGKLPVGS